MSDRKNLRITGGKVLEKGPEGLRIAQKTIFVQDGIIRESAGEGPCEEIRAEGKLILPGLLILHTHAYMTVLRNYADDVDFDEWLFRRVMPVEDSLPPEGAYWCSLLACMEFLRTGTTCFADMHMFPGGSCRAVIDSGMRGYIGRGLVGEDLYTDGAGRFEQALREIEEYGHVTDRLSFVLSPHAIYSCSPRLYAQTAEEAEKRGLLKQTHLSESDNEVDNCIAKYGKTPVKVIAETGFMDEKTLLAHCVKLRGNDAKILAQSGATVVTNPASNAKLGNGHLDLPLILDNGINLCIGTDGTSSNNTLNLFREMGLFTMIHKAATGNAAAAPARQVAAMVTENPAKAVGMEGKLGVIADGAKADLVFMDLREPSLYPANDLISALCYSANGMEVESVMVDGRFVMKNREFTLFDAEQVRWEVGRIADKYL